MWLVSKDVTTDRMLLCVHGGGYVSGSMYTHRTLFAHLAKAAGVRALIPDYRRTPEFRYPAQLDDVTTAYAWLLDQRIDAGHTAFTGDSAGGGLTVATTLRPRQQGLRPHRPAAGVPAGQRRRDAAGRQRRRRAPRP